MVNGKNRKIIRLFNARPMEKRVGSEFTIEQSFRHDLGLDLCISRRLNVGQRLSFIISNNMLHLTSKARMLEPVLMPGCLEACLTTIVARQLLVHELCIILVTNGTDFERCFFACN